MIFQLLTDCACYTTGTGGDITCDEDLQCNCSPGFTGQSCFFCADGYYDTGACEPCGCNLSGTTLGSTSTCSPAGACNCEVGLGYVGQKCDECRESFYLVGSTCNGKNIIIPR